MLTTNLLVEVMRQRHRRALVLLAAMQRLQRHVAGLQALICHLLQELPVARQHGKAVRHRLQRMHASSNRSDNGKHNTASVGTSLLPTLCPWRLAVGHMCISCGPCVQGCSTAGVHRTNCKASHTALGFAATAQTTGFLAVATKPQDGGSTKARRYATTKNMPKEHAR